MGLVKYLMHCDTMGAPLQRQHLCPFHKETRRVRIQLEEAHVRRHVPMA